MAKEISRAFGMKRVAECFPETWLCRDGTEIPVGDLTDSHLENICNFILEHGEYSIWGYGGKWFPIILEEIEIRKRR